MSEAVNQQSNPEVDENGKNISSCGGELKDHIEDIVTGMLLTGVGGGCVDTYRALLEVAEHLKQHDNYPDYTPTGTTVKEVLDGIGKKMQAAREAAQEEYLKNMPLSKRAS